MIRVLIVEDSPVEQALLVHILGSDPQLQVAGVAGDGEKAVAAIKKLKPDLVTMDIHMPRLNGFETTRRLMEETPLPIVIVSGSFSSSDIDKTFRALEAGALTVVRKPHGIGHPHYDEDARELIKTVKTMSEVKVVRRWPKARSAEPPPPLPTTLRQHAEIRAVAIGASTGGPSVIQTILTGLPRNFAAPVFIVQHITSGFIHGFVTWLTATTGFTAKVATHGESPQPGRAYFAPDGCHMAVGSDGRIAITRDAPDNGLRPSVSRLFRSVGEVFGNNCVAVLLTGMGKDGAEELKALRSRGAITIVQDRESSVVFGMPGEALKLDAADYIFSPQRIATFLAYQVKGGKK